MRRKVISSPRFLFIILSSVVRIKKKSFLTMILVAAVLSITLVASGPISSSLLSSLSLVNAQTSTQTTSYDTGLVTCSGTSQVCDTHPSFTVQTNSVLEAQFTAATIHCSAISVDVSVDGGSSHSLGTLGPGPIMQMARNIVEDVKSISSMMAYFVIVVVWL